MNAMVMERRVVQRTGRERIRRESRGLASWVAFVIAVLITLALLPVYAGAAASTPVDQPQPLAAPAPSFASGIDFPEQAQPWGACSALVEHSAAIDNARSDRANELTSVLYQDACFGA